MNFSVQRSNETYSPQSPSSRFEGKRDPLEQFEVDFKDVQDLQRFEELLRRVKTALEINEDSIRSLKALNNKLRDLAGVESSPASWSEIDIEAEQQLATVARHKRNFDTLLKNVHGRAQLVCSANAIPYTKNPANPVGIALQCLRFQKRSHRVIHWTASRRHQLLAAQRENDDVNDPRNVNPRRGRSQNPDTAGHSLRPSIIRGSKSKRKLDAHSS